MKWIQSTSFRLGLLSLLALSCKHRGNDSELHSGGRRIGSFKGLATVQMTIKGRLYLPSTFFDLKSFLGDYSDEGLTTLLGAYDGRSGSSSLQNAAPNAVNTMLWQIVMDGAASQIAEYACVNNYPLLDTHFEQVANKVCKWPSGADDRAQTLREFWLDLMRYDAPQAEMEAWVAQMTAPSGTVDTLKGEILVKELTQSILMNPYFLLEQ